jgi:hypothetical protein
MYVYTCVCVYVCVCVAYDSFHKNTDRVYINNTGLSKLHTIKKENLTGLVTSFVGTKIRYKERYKRREEEQEDVCSYWENIRKREDT